MAGPDDDTEDDLTDYTATTDTGESDTGDTGEDAGAGALASVGAVPSTSSGALDSPEAQQAFNTLIKSNTQARAALQQARQKIQARKYNNAQTLFALSAALGSPTRTGAFGETMANVGNALQAPLHEKEAFEQQRTKELLGLDTQLAGLDTNTAQAQLRLAELKARLASEQAKAPNELVFDGKDASGKDKWKWASHLEARGQRGPLPGGATVNVGPQNAGKKKYSEQMYGEYFNIQKSGTTGASDQTAKLNRLENLIGEMDTGKATPALSTLASIGESFGIKLDPNLGAKQAADSLSKEMALMLRNPSEGAGMPGNFSDGDRGYLNEITPGLAQTKEGRKLIIQTARALIQRKRDFAKITREYKKKNNGELDDGLWEVMDQYANEHPMFRTNEGKPLGGAVAPSSFAAPGAGGTGLGVGQSKKVGEFTVTRTD